MEYKIIDLGLVSFDKAYAFQKRALSSAKAHKGDESLILAQHYPVFTIGRLGKKENILEGSEKLNSRGIDIVNTDRGGDITFHGPGQIIAYPIFDLTKRCKDMHKFLRWLEEVIILLLSDYGINSFRAKDRTGCWTGRGKIASIGVAASGWVTYHGLALNANVDLSYFDMINPCGFNDISMTSMKETLRKEVDMENLKKRLICRFGDVFGLQSELTSNATF
jgi:lipoate-protein ligase B